MAPKSKKYTSTPNMKKRQARARPKANVSEPDTATEEVESSTLEIPKGSKDRQSKKMNIKVTSLVQALHTQSHKEILRMPASDHLSSTCDPRVYHVLSRLVRVCTAFTPRVPHAVAVAPNFCAAQK